MPLAAAAISPHPPLVVPAMAGRAAGELDGLRSALGRAIDQLMASRLDRLVIVGGGPVTRCYASPSVGTLRGFGLVLDVSLDGGPATGDSLPLSLTIGAWLLRYRGVRLARTGQSVAADTPAGQCAELGASLVAGSARVGLLIMGNGSALPLISGYPDPRASAFDGAVAAALEAAEPKALLALDAGLAAELHSTGRAPWQVLAGAAAGAHWAGQVEYAAAPYRVGYMVATWVPA